MALTTRAIRNIQKVSENQNQLSEKFIEFQWFRITVPGRNHTNKCLGKDMFCGLFQL